MYRPRSSCRLHMGPKLPLMAEGVDEPAGVTLESMDGRD